MPGTWCQLRLRGEGNSLVDLRTRLTDVDSVWRDSGIEVWGRFGGLFGLASNESILMLHGAADLSEQDFRQACGHDIEIIGCLRLAATLRPRTFTPLTRPGVYVFRTFRVPGRDVDEVVELSGAAWETFELGTEDAAADYRAEPQGLFREKAAGRSEDQDVLLLTWYDDLASWERSRTPDPAATERFRRRHALTRWSSAIATRLLD